MLHNNHNQDSRQDRRSRRDVGSPCCSKRSSCTLLTILTILSTWMASMWTTRCVWVPSVSPCVMSMESVLLMRQDEDAVEVGQWIVLLHRMIIVWKSRYPHVVRLCIVCICLTAVTMTEDTAEHDRSHALSTQSESRAMVWIESHMYLCAPVVDDDEEERQAGWLLETVFGDVVCVLVTLRSTSTSPSFGTNTCASSTNECATVPSAQQQHRLTVRCDNAAVHHVLLHQPHGTLRASL